MEDVQIVGAGPAGCIAAKEAAKAGLNVAVFEQQKEVGARLKCSGLISKKGLDSLGVDYRRAVMNKIYGARIHSPSLNRMDVISKKLQAFVVDRMKFDLLCAEEAEGVGAKLKLGRKARKLDLKSKLIIGADGALSDVAKWFCFPKINEFAFCYQTDFENVEVDDKRVVDMFLSNALFPGFFGWVIPLSESEVRVGLGVFRDVRKQYNNSVKYYFNKFLKHPIVSELLKNSKEKNTISAVIPLSVRESTAKGNVILVGDAAGQVKATTGGGVVFGGNCARVAGRLAPLLIQKGAEQYEVEWRRKFERDLTLHRRMRRMYNALSDSQIERYFSFAKKIGVESFLINHGDMDSPTRMIESANTLFGSSLGGW
jgi:geranylgeranyl reductase family protein